MTENKIHFFHHDTGGIFRIDISPNGCIIVVNQTGTHTFFLLHLPLRFYVKSITQIIDITNQGDQDNFLTKEMAIA